MLFDVQQITQIVHILLDPDCWAVVRLAMLRRAGELDARPLVSCQMLNQSMLLIDISIQREDGSIEHSPSTCTIRFSGRAR